MMTFCGTGYEWPFCFFLPASTSASDANRTKQSNKDITCRKRKLHFSLIKNFKKKNNMYQQFKKGTLGFFVLFCFPLTVVTGSNTSENQRLSGLTHSIYRFSVSFQQQLLRNNAPHTRSLIFKVVRVFWILFWKQNETNFKCLKGREREACQSIARPHLSFAMCGLSHVTWSETFSKLHLPAGLIW